MGRDPRGRRSAVYDSERGVLLSGLDPDGVGGGEEHHRCKDGPGEQSSRGGDEESGEESEDLSGTGTAAESTAGGGFGTDRGEISLRGRSFAARKDVCLGAEGTGTVCG